MNRSAENTIQIEAFVRNKNAQKSNELIPAILYGKNRENIPVFLQEKAIINIANKVDFFTTKMMIIVGKNTYNVFPKAIERHPVNDKILHIDFIFSNPRQILSVPIIYSGIQELTTIKQGGYFNIIKRNIKILCSDGKYIKHIFLDLPKIRKFRTLKISDLKEKVENHKILENENIVIASVVSRKRIIDEEQKTDEQEKSE